MESRTNSKMNGGVMLAVGLAKHNSGALLLCDGKEKLCL